MKIVITREIPPEAQAKVEELKLKSDIVQWYSDSPMPRDKLLTEIENADGLLCLITDKIDENLLSRASNCKTACNWLIS
jgi:lactate dehydrogenase-like 2-hydroxyacid dehydrogenase